MNFSKAILAPRKVLRAEMAKDSLLDHKGQVLYFKLCSKFYLFEALNMDFNRSKTVNDFTSIGKDG